MAPPTPQRTRATREARVPPAAASAPQAHATARPYTVRDTPAVVRRIEADLGLVVDTVRHGDPALRSLILTGGFARGEGAVLKGAPQNDYDLVAVRGPGRPRVPYPDMKALLERRLGLHIDLAPVPPWRLRTASRSIFWYETALRGRVLWGEDALGRIPVCSPAMIHPKEAMRLLGNRAAGLLLAIGAEDPMRRIQASKGLLAALDAHLLAAGHFPPSQTERQELFLRLRRSRRDPPGLRPHARWILWAYRFKTEPDHAPHRGANAAWHAAAQCLLEAVPVALRHGGAASLEEHAMQDGILDHAYYAARSGRVPGARRLARSPSGRVRLATLRLLESAVAGAHPTTHELERHLGGMLRARDDDGADDAVGLLERMRQATLQ